jgi:dTDP-4-dehydrorhamnose 3,5-epimerase-like enzyme
MTPDELMESASLIVQDSEIATLRRQLVDTDVQLKLLLQTYGENHPEVVRFRAGREELQQKMANALNGLKRGVRADYEVSLARDEALDQELKAAREADIAAEGEKYLPFAKAERELELVYIDDVVDAFLQVAEERPQGFQRRTVPATGRIRLGELADRIRSFRAVRHDLWLPDFSDPLTHRLYATYLSYLPTDAFDYPLLQREDPRGVLAEFVKSNAAGQIFVSRTKPGVVRGNHHHRTKTEKFLVLEGEAVVRFRHIDTGERIDVRVRGEDLRPIDIPPGYTHCIENVGDRDLVTLFWASEPFDPERPDTTFEEVGP